MSDHGADHDGGNGHSHDHGQHGGHDHGHGHGHDHGERAATVAVVTVSTSLAEADGDLEDESGAAARELLEADGRDVVARLVSDDEARIAATVENLVGEVDAVVTTGGTGLTPDDVTPEAVRPLFDRELPGFGELFRRLSAEQIGTRAMLSRATGGVIDGTAVFCLPGSPDAVRLGVGEVVLPEVDHVVDLARA